MSSHITELRRMAAELWPEAEIVEVEPERRWAVLRAGERIAEIGPTEGSVSYALDDFGIRLFI